MVARVVRKGEHLDGIAYRHGVSAEEVWSSDKNRGLREKRSGGHILLAGDALELPDRKHPAPAELSVGAENIIVANVPKVKVEMVLNGPTGPVSGEPWHVEARGEDAKGSTGGDGKVSFELRVTTSYATLVLEGLGQRRHVEVGGLDPVEAMSGVAHRLRNLGFDPGEVSSSLTPELSRAITAFQETRHMAPTGHPDADTLAALEAAHGS